MCVFFSSSYSLRDGMTGHVFTQGRCIMLLLYSVAGPLSTWKKCTKTARKTIGRHIAYALNASRPRAPAQKSACRGIMSFYYYIMPI